MTEDTVDLELYEKALKAALEDAISRIGFTLDFLLRLTPRVEMVYMDQYEDRRDNVLASYADEKPWKKKVVATFTPTLLWKGYFLVQGVAWFNDTGYAAGFS